MEGGQKMKDFNTKRTWGPSPLYPAVLGAQRDKSLPDLIVLAGPCSVESFDHVDETVPVLKACGATFARGGVYRAGTYPREVFGLQLDLLKYWSSQVRKAGLKTVVEVLDVRQVEKVDRYADVFQVGARHCQDYALLVELSKSKKVVTLKRNPGMTLDEFLGAAEYLARGRCSPILIERGSATQMNHVRWDLSISLIAAAKRLTNLPVLVDASHGTGRSDLVWPMTMAGLAAGADGFLVEVHPDPEKSMSDADQAVHLLSLAPMIAKAHSMVAARGS